MRPPLFLRRIIFIGCCIFALTLPFDFSLKNINLNIPLIKSLLTLEIVILILVWELVIILERRVDIKLTPLFLPIAVFFVIHIFSAIFPSAKMVWSLKYTFRFFGLGLIFFIIINFITDKKRLDYLINFLLIGAGLAALFVLIQYRFPYLLTEVQYFFEDVDVSPHRIRGLFGWPTNMSVYLGSFVPLIISSLIYKPNKGRFLEKIFYVFLLFIIMLALIFSQARGWIVGLFFGLSTLWILYLIKEKDYKVLWITIIILTFGFIFFFTTGMYKFIMSDLDPSETGRLVFAKEALGLIKEHPFKGIGADMFYWDSICHYRTHNIFLETAVNLGIFGLLILLWLFYTIFKLIGKGLTESTGGSNRHIQVGIFASLVSFLAHNQVDYFWNQHEIIGLFWILVGIGVCVQVVGGLRN